MGDKSAESDFHDGPGRPYDARMRNRSLVISTVFYVAVAALLAGVLFKIWPQVLPASVATRIGHNSEGYILALAVAPWIQFVRPRLSGTRAEWIVAILVGLA